MPLQSVILQHDLPDGSSHFDWLLAVDDPPTRPLQTWRCAERPDLAPVNATLALKRLDPHRPAYLTYEGPVSGNRGSVSRVASGCWECLATARAPSAGGETLRIEVTWSRSGEAQRWEIDRDSARRTA